MTFIKRNLLFLAVTIIPAFSAVTLTNYEVADRRSGIRSTTLSDFALLGGNGIALAVTYTAQNDLLELLNVEYGGEPLTLAGSVTDSIGLGARTSAIYYLVNPLASEGDVTISFSSMSRFVVSAVALGNIGRVGMFVGATGQETTGSSLRLDYTTDSGAYYVSAATDDSILDSIPSYNLSGVSGEPIFQDAGQNSGGAATHWISGEIEGGDQTTSVGFSNSATLKSAALLVFEEQGTIIPESSSVLLIVLGALNFISYRKRS